FDAQEDVVGLRVEVVLHDAGVPALVADVHLLNLQAVLVLIPASRHHGNAGIRRPFVISREHDAGAVEPRPL
ncbi:hypothetical protein ANANG_G00132470, partial [Anguilla anguilla]